MERPSRLRPDLREQRNHRAGNDISPQNADYSRVAALRCFLNRKLRRPGMLSALTASACHVHMLIDKSRKRLRS